MSVADSRLPPIIQAKRGRQMGKGKRREMRAYTQVFPEKQMGFKTGHGPSSLFAKVLFPSRARTRALDPRPSLCSLDRTVPLMEFSNPRSELFICILISLVNVFLIYIYQQFLYISVLKIIRNIYMHLDFGMLNINLLPFSLSVCVCRIGIEYITCI